MKKPEKIRLSTQEIKIKSRFNFEINPSTGKEIGCEYEAGTWCNLPKYKRCSACMRCVDGSKACYVTATSLF